MSLTLYNKKRHFSETPEPKGKEKSSQGALHFVVQKHDASSVHYDFRLEMDGVLKSWAVPKGPSLNPADKRLAMMVEDHPFDYRNFEGVIPEGNYGAGTVIVWDEGTYHLAGGNESSRKEEEKKLLHELYSGNVKLELHGKKLKGEFALFQMKGKGGKSWILVKKKDEYATEEDITDKNTSVKTGKTIAQVAAENGTVPNHPEEEIRAKSKKRPVQLLNALSSPKDTVKTSKAAAGKTPGPATRLRKSKGVKVKELLGDSLHLARTAPMPQDVVPMLATLTNEPFDNKNWIFEIKWDGYRAVAYCDHENVELISRNLSSFTEKYYPVARALQQVGLSAVLDGEIVAVNEKGLAAFQLLQNWQNTPVRLQFFVFDILWLDGYDLTALPLIERKRILKEVIPTDHAMVKYSDHVAGKGKDFFKVAINQGLEGIMAKKANSVYQIKERTKDWVKIKVNQRQEVIIAGYTKPRNTRKFFGSLLLGIYDDDELVYVGHTGSGFNTKSLETIYNKMQPLVVDESPFTRTPKTNMPATWIRPKLVCEIKFTEWTKDRMARHPIFMGLRVDKKAKEVVFEKAVNMATLSKRKQKVAPKKKATQPARTSGRRTAQKKAAAATKSSSKKKTEAEGDTAKLSPEKSRQSATSSRRSLVRSAVKTSGLHIDINVGNGQSITLNGHELKLTNLDKLYWKKEGFRKGDMINYYLQMAPYILPYMMDRPQSLNRHPNGIEGPNFFQKDMRGKLPDWMQTHEDYSESTETKVEYLVCSNEATLIYMANLGCIEMHPWHSRSQSWERPDWCLIDLDPDKSNTFQQVIETAQIVKKVLDSIGATCCVKTSGSTGIHIYIPLGAKYNYDQSRQLAELVVRMVNQELPELTSVERSPAKRKGLIYLDFLQNRETQTAAAPYSLRPKPGVPVSTPLDWSEVKKGLTPTTYHAKNIYERVKNEGDLFKPVLGKGIDLDKVLSKLVALIK
jgi:bifunctional non-homologous end joining protein LigD